MWLDVSGTLVNIKEQLSQVLFMASFLSFIGALADKCTIMNIKATDLVRAEALSHFYIVDSELKFSMSHIGIQS